ncbi:DUF2878 domain-containing protein [Oceanobacter kriegii]|uniref:DUF2878 domain-containing protein n=1 Tax=Oceanobacter kriegii TaxID=64972 RepID=UPI0004022E38|nr:DUF2878 domain-containing protein [Oceanobacter kriegii]
MNKQPLRLKRSHQLILNIAMFQLVWFACILGGNLWALAVTPLLVLWHRTLLQPGEWQLITAYLLAGAVLDTLLIGSGQLQLANHQGPLLPYWLWLLWGAFATTLLHSLHWLVLRRNALIVAGGLLAPLSYYTGAQLQQATLTTLGLLVIGLQWAMLMALTHVVVIRRTAQQAGGES